MFGLGGKAPLASPGNNLNDFFFNGRGCVLTVFYQAPEIALNGFTNVFDRFVTGMSLRNTTRQRRAFRYEDSVLLRFNNHSEVHGTI
jgi:hypothetical protein